jgi:hypothetical protein
MDAIRARMGASETPATLWAYAVIAVVSGLVAGALSVASHLGVAIFAVVFTLVLFVVVVRGSRVAWILVTGSNLFELFRSPFSPRPWWALVLSTVGLALLLAPPTWRFVWRRQGSPRAAGQAMGNPGEDSASGNRAAGWYVDPGTPSQMRYWSTEDGQWLGTTKTPRKIREQWLSEQHGANTKESAELPTSP